MTAELGALIFDVDGTLADTERDGHRVAFNRAFARAGLPWSWGVERYGKLLAVAGGKERIRHFIDIHEPQSALPHDLEAFIDELHGLKTTYYQELLRSGAIPLRPGVERLLREARDEGLQLAIATTTSRQNVVALLESTLGSDSLGWFTVIAGSDIVAQKKPAPDAYHYALRYLGLHAEQCVAFEDSVNGALAARRARLDTIVTVNGYTRDDRFGETLLVVDQLGEPDSPFEVLRGEAGEARYVTLDLIRRLRR